MKKRIPVYSFEFKIQATSLEEASRKAVETIEFVNGRLDLTSLGHGGIYKTSRLTIIDKGNSIDLPKSDEP